MWRVLRDERNIKRKTGGNQKKLMILRNCLHQKLFFIYEDVEKIKFKEEKCN